MIDDHEVLFDLQFIVKFQGNHRQTINLKYPGVKSLTLVCETFALQKVQECKYCQLYLDCAIRNELDQ